MKPYVLTVVTDFDFALKFKGDIHTEDIVLRLDSVEELDEIEILGAWGAERTPNTKCWEYEQAVEAIKANPEENYNSMGGNRGVLWSPILNCT